MKCGCRGWVTAHRWYPARCAHGSHRALACLLRHAPCTAHRALLAAISAVAVYVEVRAAKLDLIILSVVVLQGLAISLGQASLKMNSMSFFQLTKQMQVPLVATIEFFWLGRRLSTVKVCLLLTMTFGVCLSNASDVQFTVLGAVMAVAGTVCTSAEVVLYSWLQQSQGWETLQLLYNTMPYCTALMLVVALYNDILPEAGV